MKSNLFTLIMILSIVPLSAQSSQSVWSLGIETGFLSSGIENQNPYGVEKLPAVNTYGNRSKLVLSRQINKGFSINVEPTYAHLGQNYLDVRTTNDYFRKISLEYLQLPLMLSKNFGEGKMKINLKGGVYGSYLISSSFEESSLISEGGVVGPSKIELNSNRFNNLDFGFNFSLGTQVELCQKLALTAHYDISAGIIDINADSYVYEPGYKIDYKKSRNISNGLNLGLRYNF